MSKFNAGKSSILAIATALVGAFVLLGNTIFTSVSANNYPTPTPSCGTFEYTFDSDGNNGKVDVDFENNGYQVDVDGINGWAVTKVWLDEFYDSPNDGNNNDDSNNWVYVANNEIFNYNPSNFGLIDDVKVEVAKACATATPTATPTQVTICHATHSDGNPFNQITVSWEAVDGNGNGNADHNRNDHQDGEDIIPAGFWDADGRNWDATGQAIWNNQCNPVVSSPTPSATATPTATPTGTPIATATPTATPTIDPCVRNENCEEATPTPVATETPFVSPNCTGDTHLDAAGKNCVAFEYGGPQVQSGSSAPQVLGASTMAGAGSFTETFYQAIMGLGGIFTIKGLKKVKKASKKA